MSTLKYIIVLFIISFIGGTLAYLLYPIFINDKYNINKYSSNLGLALLATLITYSTYLITTSFLKRKPTLMLALLCLVVSSAIWIIPASATFGFQLNGALLFVVSIGLTNAIAPYLDTFICKLFSNHNRLAQ